MLSVPAVDSALLAAIMSNQPRTLEALTCLDHSRSGVVLGAGADTVGDCSDVNRGREMGDI
jgi:hypothetical protein